MDHNFNNRITEPCLYSYDSIIIEVNKQFIDLTGFTMDELLGKSFTQIGDMLKINLQILIDNIEKKHSGYIFTKSLKAREVNVSLFNDKGTNKKVYTFIEKPNSRLDDKLIFVEQAFIDDISGVAVYSVPDLILLKANQKYLDLMDSPFNNGENSIGRPIKEMVKGFVCNLAEIICNSTLETQTTSYIKEFGFDDFTRDITYWSFTQTTIFESGKMKYIFKTASEITEKFFKNQNLERQIKIIQQQKEQFEHQNTQLINIIENLSEAVMVSDNKGKFIMVNLEAKKLIYEPDQVITSSDVSKNTKYFDMKGNEIPFENLPGIRALRRERVKDVKMFVSNPNKEYFMKVSSIPIYNTNKDLTMVVTCFHDITEEIKQSRKIEEHKNQLEAVIENISDDIFIFDNKGQYILSNKSAGEMFPASYEYMGNIGDGYKQAEYYDVAGEKIDLENIASRRVMRGERFKNMKMSVKFPHKTLQIDVSGSPIYDSEGKFTLGVLCSRDMTDYFKHEEAVRNGYEFMNRMIDTFDLPVVRLSCPDLKIVDINKKAFRIIKLLNPDIIATKQIKEKKIEDLFETLKTNEYYQCINGVKKEMKPKYLNKKFLLLNGKEVYWNIIFEPMLEVNGKLQEILILIIDVTAEIRSNLLMKKTLRLQGEFLANISHELKTPLNVLSSTVQLFNMYYCDRSLDQRKDSISKYIESMRQNCFRLSKLINNIVDSSKIEAGFFKLNLSNNNIVEVVEEIVMSVTNFTKSKGLNIVFDTDIEEKIIACDPEKMERIVLNLISNAIKFSEKGDEIFVDVKDKNEFVEISVKDNGIGIEKEQLGMIFDRFKQVNKSLSRNAEGTGIGLSLVKSITKLHGGSIYVESEVGKGSKFTVMLPAKKVDHENVLYNSIMVNKNKSVQVELSDVL